MLAALYILAALGLDEQALPSAAERFSKEAVSAVSADRAAYVSRINAGIAASGL